MRRLIHGLTLRKDGDVTAGMPIIRRDTLHRTLLKVMVVPRHEGRGPGTRRAEIRKRLRRKRRRVFERAKQVFGVRVYRRSRAAG